MWTVVVVVGGTVVEVVVGGAVVEVVVGGAVVEVLVGGAVVEVLVGGAVVEVLVGGVVAVPVGLATWQVKWCLRWRSFSSTLILSSLQPCALARVVNEESSRASPSRNFLASVAQRLARARFLASAAFFLSSSDVALAVL